MNWVKILGIEIGVLITGVALFLLRRQIAAVVRATARGVRRVLRPAFERISFLVIAILLFLAAWMLFGKFALVGLMIFLVISGLVLALAWFYLAPNNMFFTFVDEGTAKIVVRGGEARKVLIQFKNHKLDQNWNVVSGQERHLFGGLRWIGIWPLNEMYIYQFKWTNVLHDGTIQPHPAEWLDYILLKQDVYYFAESTAEDADLLPLKVEIFLTLRVMNPYRALFQVQDWLETIINRFRPSVRDRVAQDRYGTLISQKGSMASELFAASADARQQFLNEYGVETVAVEIKDIEPPEEYRNATLQKWQAERDAEQIRVSADAEAGRIDREYEPVIRKGWRGLLIRWLESRERR